VEYAARGSLEIEDAKMMPKIAICAPLDNFVFCPAEPLQLRHVSTVGKNTC